MNRRFLFILSTFLALGCLLVSSCGITSPRSGEDLLIHTSRVHGEDVDIVGASFNQIYYDTESTLPESRFGPIVRIVEFGYDVNDEFVIAPRFTTGYNEGATTGEIVIVLDEYELTYIDSLAESSDYVEKIQYEGEKDIQYRNRFTPRLTGSPFSVTTMGGRKSSSVKPINLSRSQIYNELNILVNGEDRVLIKDSETIYFLLKLEKSTLKVYPSNQKLKRLRKRLSKY